MAVTQNTYTGNGTTTNYSFTFPYLETTDIKVSLNGVDTTAYTLANATTVSFNTAPANGAAIRIYRDTDDAALAATFYPGSAIRSQDLNDNFTQNLYVTQEINNNAVSIDGSNPMVSDFNMNGYKITNLAAPVASTDAANRSFVEGVFSSEVPVFYRRWSKTAVGGETSLSGNDNSGIALSYVPGSEKVFINGALQIRGVDYLGTTGSTLTGIPALTAGDIIEVHSSSSYTVGTVPDGSVTNAKVDSAAAIQSTKLAFTQAGTGAATRTVESKLRDVVSVKDFGAVGDGVTNDATAINNARVQAVSEGKPLLIPAGSYNVSGTTYNTYGPFLYLDDAFTGGVNLALSARNQCLLLTGETPNTTPLAAADSRTLLNSTVIANGANHADAGRFNLVNKSTDGDGNTAIYTNATSYSNAYWSAALHGETRHNGGTSIGCNVEAAAYTPNGSLFGIVLNNTTGLSTLHPETGGASTSAPATNNIAAQIIGRSGIGDLGLWYYGINMPSNSIKTTGTAMRVAATCTHGLDLAGSTFSGRAIRLSDGHKISFEDTNVVTLGYNSSVTALEFSAGTGVTGRYTNTGVLDFTPRSSTGPALRLADQHTITFEPTNAIKLGYNSAASGGAALEVSSGVGVNIRLYNSGICDFRGSVRPTVDNTNNLGASTLRWAKLFSKELYFGSGTPFITSGVGTPEGQITAPVGSMFTRTDGGASTTLYIKESGTGNTGWVAK